ncbi:MAG: S1 RNA-binding domain-containing protein [Bdellovibrionota bacterium]
MAKAITQPRTEMSKYAPRITTITVPVDKIREVIGSGGKVIRDIVARMGCKIDIIKGIIAEVEVGKTYKGIVKKIVEFGAFVGVMPNQDGLLHISEIAHERVNNVLDYMKEGDEIEVKVIEVDKSGKVRLSRKVLLPMPEGMAARGPSGPGGGGGGGDRGPRGGGDRDRGPRGGGDRDRGPRR